MILFGLLVLVLVPTIIGGIIQYRTEPKPPHGYTLQECQQWYYNKEWLHADDEEDESQDETTQERITLLDETIVKYQRLLDTLTAQYKNTSSETEKAKILSKQISTMEKLNRALEKRERLD